MSVLSNWYKNKAFVRPVVLLAVGAALGAGSVGYLGPLVLPFVHQLLCQDDPICLGQLPAPLPIPEKPKKDPICIEVNGVKLCK